MPKTRGARKRNKKGTRKFKKATCSIRNPNKHKPDAYSCYTPAALKDMKRLWNARHPDDPIRATRPRDIWVALRDAQRSTCDIESCWMDNLYRDKGVNKEDTDAIFAPGKPKQMRRRTDTFLDSSNLRRIMRNYEKRYPEFRFIGPSPRDYDAKVPGGGGACVMDDLCNFDLADMERKGVRLVGVIFNTDPHDKPGDHWLVLVVDLKRGQVCHFCSYGDPPNEECQRFMDTVCEQSKSLPSRAHTKRRYRQLVNPHQYQRYGSSSCGVYCMYILDEMLRGKSFSAVAGTPGRKKRMDDGCMERIRMSYFFNDQAEDRDAF
jgi:hypothetical protein